MRTEINHSQRRMRIETFRLVPASLSASLTQTTTGVPEGAYRCTAAKASTGLLQIVFKDAFTRIPTITVACVSAAGTLYATISAVSKTGASFRIYSDAGALTDATEVHLQVIGADTVDQQG